MADLIFNATSVIVYRASPGVKALFVKWVRSTLGELNCKTLAIGDGANDINMIQSSHVGVGIRGREGNQAASFADFSIQ